MGANIKTSSGSQRVLSEINVTPLVDVMLVLLVMFMVTAPLLQQGIEIEVPKTKAGGLEIKGEPLRLQVSAQKKIVLAQQALDFKTLETQLKKKLSQQSDKQVFIQADHRVDYGFIAQVMVIVKRAGATSLGLITEPQLNE